jgi:hypothetical protein
MEIVLLWLDDLDDLVFWGARLWEPVRRVCLQIGLAAAIALAAAELAASAQWASTLAAIAAASVAIWLAGAACLAVKRIRLVRRPALA